MIVNKRIFILLSMIFLLVLVSGCPGEKKTEVISTDLLVIGDITVIPSETVKPEDTIIIRMEVENVGQTDVWMLVDKQKYVSGNNKRTKNGDGTFTEAVFGGDMVLVNYCTPLYTLESFQVVSKTADLCTLPTDPNMLSALPTISGATSALSCYLKFKQGETHVFQWTIKAPSKDRIAGMTNDCKLNFQAIYGSMAKTLTYVYFAKPGELAQRIYTNKEMTLAGDNIASYGPVVANFETDAQPIRAGIGDDWTVFLNLKNLGSGIAKISYIGLYTMDGTSTPYIFDGTACELDASADKITLSIDRAKVEQKITSNCDGGKKKEDPACNKLYDQKRKLEIFILESSRVSCTVKVPGTATFKIMQPYKFKALAMYSYSQGKDLKITTDPTP